MKVGPGGSDRHYLERLCYLLRGPPAISPRPLEVRGVSFPIANSGGMN
jgi:hypothetical protein